MKINKYQLILVLAICFISIEIFAIQDIHRRTSFSFEENQGQFKDMDGNLTPNVLFKLQANGIDVYVTTSGLTYVFQSFTQGNEMNKLNTIGFPSENQKIEFHWERVDMLLENAQISTENLTVKKESSQGRTNYFLGHCPTGIRNVPNYGELIFSNIYSNIDWVIYNSHGSGFKYDFILHPGAKPDDIQLIYRMKNQLELINGNLNINTQFGNLEENKPISYLDDKLIYSAFKLDSLQENIFGGYDHFVSFILDEESKQLISDNLSTHKIIIDPELQWGTFFGGNGSESANAMKADSQNNLYIVGYNYLLDFPVQSSTGYFQGTSNGSTELVIIKFNKDGVLLWSTYYGGSSYEYLFGFDIDENDNIYCGGYTFSSDFPTEDAGTFFVDSPSGEEDAFMLKFNNQGDRVWATYIGGSGEDEIRSISAKNGVVYAVGYTSSTNFPLAVSGSYNQGSLRGQLDCFIMKFDAIGSLFWSTYYGGIGIDQANSVIIDNTGNVFITGDTQSADFETQDNDGYFTGSFGGVLDAFLLKFDSMDNRLLSTFFGGVFKDMGDDLAVDNDNNLFFYGYTQSPNIPLLDAGTFFQGIHTNLPADGFSPENCIPFLAKFNSQGVLKWSTYYGNQHSYNWQDQHNIAIDECGNLYCTTIDAKGIEDQIPFVDNGYTNSWYGQSTRLSMFSNDGQLLGATPLCTLSGHGKYIICTGKNGYFWTSTTVNGFYPQNPLDVSTLPLKEGEANTYFDNTNASATDDIFINRFHSTLIDCKLTGAPNSNENFIIPNVFTVNGDQTNDLYSLYVNGATKINFTILNRWGESIYTASGISPTWDGKNYDGKESIDGVYYIQYQIEFENGKIEKGQSFIHLIRN